MKKNIIAISILLILLAFVTIIFARQDVTIRVLLDKETLIRNGQHLIVHLRNSNDEWSTIRAETPYHSIYEYIAKIPVDNWSQTQEIVLEFGQVRRDDYIYINTISVRQPFYSEQLLQSADIYNNLLGIISADFISTDDNLTGIRVTATRAHTAAMDTIGPGLSIDIKTLSSNDKNILSYLMIILAIATVWLLFVYVVPSRIYKQIVVILHKLLCIVKTLSAIDISILIFGVLAPIFYFYGSSIISTYSEPLSHVLSSVTIVLIIIKVISTNITTNEAQDNSIEQFSFLRKKNTTIYIEKNKPEWQLYILLLVLSFIVYIPAIFPNPYYHNDEHQVINAAESYLRTGNFDSYDRAWLHSWIVAQAVKLFGDTTAVTRAVSALFGIFFIVSSYHIIKKISTNKKIAFISAIFLLFNPYLLRIFTTVRMYAIMLPISFWMFYCIYMTLHREIVYKKDNAVSRFISANFNFHFGFASITIILMILNFHIHGNAMIIPICAAIYVFALAIIKRQRKYILLSIIGLIIIALFSFIYLYRINIPVLSQIIRNLTSYFIIFSGFGNNNYIYFWSNIDTPLGAYFGIFFLSVAFGMYIRANKKTSFLLYPAICYIISVLFFIFFADRYYEYVYMSFLAPITIMLISTGYNQVTTNINTSTRFAVCIPVITVIALQMSIIFTNIYIDNPERAKFDRPYEIMLNDTKIEELENVSVFRTFMRRYFWAVFNGVEIYDLGNINRFRYQIMAMYEESNQPITYFVSEKEKMFHATNTYRNFLSTATEMITYIDAFVIYKTHFINASLPDITLSNYFVTNSNEALFSIANTQWSDDVAYLYCIINYSPEFEGAVFIAIEVQEQGLVQAATHKYQIIIPEDYDNTSMLSFELPVRPKTEEYNENILFSITDWAYVYYGNNEATEVWFYDN